jgi:biotin carboxylase
MRDILVLCPQERDVRALAVAGLGDRYRVRLVGSDVDLLPAFDPAAFVAECEGLDADGVVGTKDRSALLAAIVADRRGLPGPTPEALFACQHKPTSRAVQARVAPAATPRFAALNGVPSVFGPPWFVKPAVGRLSQLARRVDRASALARIQPDDGYQAAYAEIAELAGLPARDVHGYLVEEWVAGNEVTLEGYVFDGRVTTIGITDSVKYPGTNSFERFEYPSALPPARRAELAGIAERLLPELGFDGGFFNVEFLVPDEGPAWLVEVNGRLASQFAPLVQAVDGRSTYEALVRLACGEDPGWQPAPPNGVAVSYALRVFEDAFVEAAPEPEEGLEILARPGLRLSEQGTNDPYSYRLAIFSEWAPTREEAVARCRARAAELRFELGR